ncbi:MAG: hypothetical protein ACXU9C_28845, partial [Xanthobacteraceae bacterium]
MLEMVTWRRSCYFGADGMSFKRKYRANNGSTRFSSISVVRAGVWYGLHFGGECADYMMAESPPNGR